MRATAGVIRGETEGGNIHNEAIWSSMVQHMLLVRVCQCQVAPDSCCGASRKM
jgi:hypothetical protein